MNKIMTLGKSFYFDPDSGNLWRQQNPSNVVSFTATEARIFACLASNLNRAVSRDEIARAMLQEDEYWNAEPSNIPPHILRIRSKLGRLVSAPILITNRGFRTYTLQLEDDRYSSGSSAAVDNLSDVSKRLELIMEQIRETRDLLSETLSELSNYPGFEKAEEANTFCVESQAALTQMEYDVIEKQRCIRIEEERRRELNEFFFGTQNTTVHQKSFRSGNSFSSSQTVHQSQQQVLLAETCISNIYESLDQILTSLSRIRCKVSRTSQDEASPEQ